MNRHRLHVALTLLSALAFQTAPSDTLAAPKNRISGEAFYRERVALAPTAVFEAALEEITRESAPARVVARMSKGRPGQVPISFELRYDARRLDRRRDYQVRATIRERGRIRFEGTRAWSPAGRDRGPVRVLMRPARRDRDDRDRDDRDRGPGRRPDEGLGALTGTRWVPIEIGNRVVSVPAQREPWIRLEAGTGRVVGSGGCNRLSGRYEAARSLLRFDDLVSTRMACPDMSTENAFFDALRRTRDYRVGRRTLELVDDRDRLLARLEERNPR